MYNVKLSSETMITLLRSSTLVTVCIEEEEVFHTCSLKHALSCSVLQKLCYEHFHFKPLLRRVLETKMYFIMVFIPTLCVPL